jgi:hypothetical protein
MPMMASLFLVHAFFESIEMEIKLDVKKLVKSVIQLIISAVLTINSTATSPLPGSPC